MAVWLGIGLRLNSIMSPNSEILIGLEFLFYGPVRVGVRVGFRARVRVKVRARVRVLGLGVRLVFKYFCIYKNS